MDIEISASEIGQLVKDLEDLKDAMPLIQDQMKFFMELLLKLARSIGEDFGALKIRVTVLEKAVEKLQVVE